MNYLNLKRILLYKLISKININLSLLFLLLTLLFFTGCSPIYVAQAAYEQASILAARVPIDEVILDPDTSIETKQKLQLVKKTREYAIDIGLTPKDSFTKYSDIKRDVLSWIVMGSSKNKFEIETWWFPIIGSVPYKGYFDEKEALDEAMQLESKGLESFVRPTDAYSTLGWFNDPILSVTLKRPRLKLSDTVLHESFHSTYWFKNQVQFNETAANLIGLVGANSFFIKELSECKDNQSCNDKNAKLVYQSKLALEGSLEFSKMLADLYSQLDTLYKSNKSDFQTQTERIDIYRRIVEPYRLKHPGMQSLKEPNNAEIMQLITYFTKFELLFKLYEKYPDIRKLLEQFKKIKELIDTDESKDPFNIVKEILAKNE